MPAQRLVPAPHTLPARAAARSLDHDAGALIDRGGIVREIILATLEEEEFVEMAEQILVPAPTP